MPELPDRIPGEIILASYNNDQRDRLVERYVDATARSISTPLPVAGSVSYLTASGVFSIFDGSVWVDYADVDDLEAFTDRLDVLDNLTVDPWDGATRQFSGTTVLQAADVTIPNDGDYLISFNTLLKFDNSATELRCAARLQSNNPLLSLAFWDLRVGADNVAAEWWEQSFVFTYPLIGELAGNLLEVEMNMTTVGSVGSISNTFLSLQQVPTGSLV